MLFLVGAHGAMVSVVRRKVELGGASGGSGWLSGTDE